MGSDYRISLCNSCMALSAIGFLLMFFVLPVSMQIRLSRSDLSSVKARKHGALSVLITAGGPSRGVKSMHISISASLIVIACSFAIMLAFVYPVMVSLNTSIHWRALFITSAENVVPMDSGGSEVDCSLATLGNVFRDMHW